VGDGEPFIDGPVVVFNWRNEDCWPVEYVSPNVERLLGYSPAELYDADPPYAELIHDGDLQRVMREVERNSDGTTERFHHEPYRMVTKGGDVRWVLDYTRIVRDDGEIIGYTGYIVDITERKTQIEYVDTLNATIRSLHRVLIDADSRSEINEGVTDALAGLEGFEGAWIGAVDFASNGIVPVTRSGIEASYLDSISFSPDADSPASAARVALDRTADGEHRRPDPDGEADWHAAALSRGYRSIFTVPIRHQELVYGALSVYATEPEAFDSRTREILLELGTLVGYAITAVERRNALHGDGSRELVIGVRIDDEGPLRSLARRLSGEIEVRSVSRRTGDALRLYCLVPNTDPETVLEAAEAVPGIGSIELLSEDGTPIYGLVTRGACGVFRATVLGAGLRSVTVSERSCELVFSVRRGRDRRRFLGQVRELFGGVELKAERDAAPSDRMPWEALLAETLTDRQRDVLKSAYYAGYFDESRKRTGGEIADSLGIAQPTFSRHLRAAQRNLLSAIWDRPTGD
jgi:PAS domain S-box-containing protein